tara:strand:+ start:193 stop:564 length:372 start_codon:yes stop_codon:yes gene_type:complete
MAHYAFLNKDNIVTEVIVGKNENEDGIDWETWYGNFREQVCKRTSYNTYANEHQLGGTAFRGNYAGIGYTYDETNDVFIAPKPYKSWVLNTTDWIWEAPVALPSNDKEYEWNEETTSWDLIDE